MDVPTCSSFCRTSKNLSSSSDVKPSSSSSSSASFVPEATSSPSSREEFPAVHAVDLPPQLDESDDEIPEAEGEPTSLPPAVELVPTLDSAFFKSYNSNVEKFKTDKKLAAALVRANTFMVKNLEEQSPAALKRYYTDIARITAATSLVFNVKRPKFKSVAELINTNLCFDGVRLLALGYHPVNTYTTTLSEHLKDHIGELPNHGYKALRDIKKASKKAVQIEFDDVDSAVSESSSSSNESAATTDFESVVTNTDESSSSSSSETADSSDSDDESDSSSTSSSSSSSDSSDESSGSDRPRKKGKGREKKKKRKDKRTFWQRWTTVTTKLDKKDRSLVARFTNTVKALPGQVADQVRGLASDFASAARKIGLPENLTDFVMMLCDCIQLALTNDTAAVLLQNTRMALQYGFLGTLVIDGLAVFVRQFTKRVWQADEQNDGPADSAAETVGLKALYSALYYYTIGSLPTFTPATALKGLIAANAAFQLAKNLEHFAPYLLNMLKAGVNAIWEVVFKRPCFDVEQREIIDKMSKFTASANDIYSLSDKTRDDIRNANALVRKGTILYARATTNNVPKETVDKFKKQLDALQAWIGEEAGIAQYRDPRPPCVLTHLIGPKGVGKTTLIRFVKAGIARELGISEDISLLSIKFDSTLNFPPNPPPHAIFIDFDDGFLVCTPENYSSLVGALQRLGTGGPFQMDAASILKKDRMFYDVMFAFGTDNILPTNLPVTTVGPVARRYIGGIHWITLNPKYYLPGTKHLDLDRVTRYQKEGLIKKLDNVWAFTDHTGHRRNFSEYVSMLLAVHAKTLKVGHVLESAVQNVSANFEKVKAHISLPPEDLNAAVSKIKDMFPEAPSEPFNPKTESKGKSKDKVSATPQTLVIDDESKFDKWLKKGSYTKRENEQLLEIAKGYLAEADTTYKFRKGVLTNRGKVVTAADLHAKFILPNKAKKTSLHVPVSKWTSATIEALQDETFFVLNKCCRHGDYCYRHGKSICESYSKKAVKSSFHAVSHWVLKNPDLAPSNITYHSIVAESYSKKEDGLAYTILKTTLISLSCAAVGLLVGHVLGAVFAAYFAPYYKEQAGYGRRGATLAKASTSGIPVPTMGVPNVGAATTQVQAVEEKPNTAWLVEKLSGNVFPIAVTGGSKTANCQMLRLFANVAITVGHAFFTGSHFLSIGGHIATTYPIVQVANAKAVTDMGPVIQYWLDRKVDIAVLVLPKTLPPAKDLRDYLVRASETSVSQLRGMTMAQRRLIDVPITEVNGRVLVTPTVLEKLTEFPLGDAIDPVEYTTPTLRLGIAIKMARETLDKMCGFPIFTSNHYVGHNHAILAGIHAAKHDFDQVALMAPFPREACDAIVRDVDPKALNMAHQQGSITFTPGIPALNEKMLAVDVLGPGHAQYQNTNNTIRASPIFPALVGMKFTHPVTKQQVVVGPPDVGPSPIWKLKEPFDKVVQHDFVPTPEDYQRLKAASERVRKRILHFADPRLTQPQDRLFTIDEALNGCPELNIPGLDRKKSFGYDPAFAKFIRESVLEPCERLVLKPQYVPVVQKIVDQILAGDVPVAYVVANLKEELRKIGKNSRVTSCYNFFLLIAMRCFTMHIPAMFISGRVHNGTSFGADLSGHEGVAYEEAASDMKYTSSFDAKNFDASISSHVSGLSEEMFADFTMMRFPFVTPASARIVPLLNRFVLLVVGAIVYYFWHGRQSGHPLTTPFNITDASTVAEVAWDESRPQYGETLLNSTVSRSYGDDFESRHNNPGFSNPHISSVASRYGITLTPGMKFGPASEFDMYSSHLGRMSYRDASGFYFTPLNVDVINHIHAFIRGKDRNYAEAVRQNAEAALREWFHYDREIFEDAKSRINAALRSHHFSEVNLSFDALYVEWLRKNGVSIRNNPVTQDEADTTTMSFGGTVRHIGSATQQSEWSYSDDSDEDDPSWTDYWFDLAQQSEEDDDEELERKASLLAGVLATVEYQGQYPENVVHGPIPQRRRDIDLEFFVGPDDTQLLYDNLFMAVHNGMNDGGHDGLDAPMIAVTATRARFHLRNIGRARPQAGITTNPKPTQVKAELYSAATDNDTITKTTSNDAAINPVSTTTGVVSQSALTKHVENTVKSVTQPMEMVKISYKWELCPYPPVGSEKMLEKEYELPPVTWLTADGRGVTYAAGNLKFPEVLFTIPKIVETLGAIRYFKLGVIFKVSMVPNPFAGGRLAFCYEQATNGLTNWRSAWPCCMNLPHIDIGPCLGGTRTIELVPASHRDAYDIPNLAPTCMNGVITCHVDSPLAFMSPTPPTSIPVNLYIQVVNPTLAGYTITGGPAGFNKVVWGKALRRLIDARPQSAITEAGDKAEKGILDGVASAVKTVTSFIGDAGPLADLALLDKPYEIATVQPVRTEVAADIHYTKGITQAPMAATRPDAYSSVNNHQVFEMYPQPTWDSVLGTPGYIDWFSFDYNSAAGTVLFERDVCPTMGYMFQSDASYKNYLVTPLGYFTMYHTYWHGDMVMCFRFSAPSQQACAVRISLVPWLDAGAVPRDQSGDIESLVYTIKGDTDIFVPIYYLSSRKQCVVVGPAESEDGAEVPFSINSRIKVQVVSPISSDVTANSATVSCSVYMCALPGFVFDQPGASNLMTTTGPYFPTTVPLTASDVPAKAGRFRNIGRATPQASIRDMLGAVNFPPLSKSTRKTHSGMCDMDQTSGPIELLKRYRLIDVGKAVPYQVYNTFLPGTYLAEFMSCWAFWSGSMCFKVSLTDSQLTSTGFLRVQPGTSITFTEDFSSGMMTTDLSKQPYISFAIPFIGQDAVGEVEDLHGEFNYSPMRIEYFGPQVSPTVNIMQAVGDDFCLYRFQCTPLMAYAVPPPVKSKGKDKTSTPPKTSEKWLKKHVTHVSSGAVHIVDDSDSDYENL